MWTRRQRLAIPFGPRLRAPALAITGVLGFLAGTGGAAGGLPPTTTLTIPSLPGITLPALTLPGSTTTATTTSTTTATTTTPSLPSSTTGTTTTATPTAVTTTPVTTTGGSASAAALAADARGDAASTAGPDAPAGSTSSALVASSRVAAATAASTAVQTLAGATKLSGGLVSIPIAGVAGGDRLSLLVSAPKLVREAGQPAKLVVQVDDMHGYRVRGATVKVASVPSSLLGTIASRRSTVDGSAVFTLAVSTKSQDQSKRLRLVVAVMDAARPRTVVSRSLPIPVAAAGGRR